jgi:hypothetical protein
MNIEHVSIEVVALLKRIKESKTTKLNTWYSYIELLK